MRIGLARSFIFSTKSDMQVKAMICVSFTILFFFVLGCSTEVVDFSPCENVDEEYCEIKEVKINPCKEAAEKKPCVVRKRTNASIEFDYIPSFNTSEAFALAYSSGIVDVPMPGMDKKACNYTKCPIVSGQLNTYSNSFYLSKMYPSSIYTVKFWLWDATHKDSNKNYIGCCFIVKIKLRGRWRQRVGPYNCSSRSRIVTDEEEGEAEDLCTFKLPNDVLGTLEVIPRRVNSCVEDFEEQSTIVTTKHYQVSEFVQV
ncbi:hypothetical protein HHI36_009606 [Cryptolaemus montrouzieri]|uniref:MD-2-related lipid-recognition domain-containing protein n=1 Tax=Cryptolaemus montrouzieri TaxID=559131 RepID=A0ABD2MGB1_9CUCU